METYKINFNPEDRDAVLDVVSNYNDVIINNTEPTSISITIQQDDAEPIYMALLQQIETEINKPDIIIIKNV